MNSKRAFKIVITPEGSITSVYSERLKLTELRGIPEIHRATEVCFSNTPSFVWQVFSKKPFFPVEELIATGFATRRDAIDWEMEFLTERLEKISEFNRSHT